MTKPKLIVYTDLDGTLLDHYTYLWDDALPALEKLFLYNIPVILCTSKTRDESIYFRGQIGLDHPFIVENGAAIFSPLGYFDQQFSRILNGGYEIKSFGVSYSELVEFLQICKKELNIQLTGFNELSSDKIQKLTKLPIHQAELARRREFNEPFYFLDERSEKKLPEMISMAESRGLNITKGGRFYHVSGNHDKGLAVKTLVDFFNQDSQNQLISIGIGDSLNDLSMLQNVKVPCLVKNGHKQYNQEVTKRISPKLASDVGPKGWNNIILELLEEYDFD
jgi:mannosyl-3-phosphoglycerate phosphatase